MKHTANPHEELIGDLLKQIASCLVVTREEREKENPINHKNPLHPGYLYIINN